MEDLSFETDFAKQCSDIVLSFKDLVTYSDPNISAGNLLDLERSFLNLSEQATKGLRSKTQGIPFVDSSIINSAIADFQQSCFNEIINSYERDGNTRMTHVLTTMKGLNTLPKKQPQSVEYDFTSEEPAHASASNTSPSVRNRSWLNRSSLITGEEAEGEERPWKEQIRDAKAIRNAILSRIGILTWIFKYNLGMFRGDLVASIAVGLMIIPQGMAYALLAGVPPIYGLYTAFIPLFVYFIFGSSHELAIGPTAMVSLIIPTAVGNSMNEDLVVGTDEYTTAYVELVIFYAFCYGLILFLLGIFKIGFLLENILSRPALSGFTQGATILIACSQLKNVIGFHPHTVIYTVDNLITGLITALVENTVNWKTAALGIPSMIIILVMKKVKKTFPTIVLVLGTGILIVFLIDKYGGGIEHTHIDIVKTVPPGLPKPKAINFSRNELTSTIGALIVLVFIGFVETISVAKKFAAENQYTLNFNQELLALGMCNMIGPWFQAYPVAGSLPRTVVNAHTGAKSPLATLMAAIIVMFMLLFGTGIIYYVPLCVLGAIVMSAALSIIDYSDVRYMWRIGQRLDALQFIAVALATAFFGPIMGVSAAGLLSLVQVIYHSGRPEVAELGRIGETGVFRSILRFTKAERVNGIAIVSMSAPRLSFYNFPWFREGLEGIEAAHEVIPVDIATSVGPLPVESHDIVRLDEDNEGAGADVSEEGQMDLESLPGPSLHTIIIDCTPLDGIDATSIQYLREMVKSYHEKGKLLLFAHAKKAVSDLLKISGTVPAAQSHKYIFATLLEAVEFAQQSGKKEAEAAQEVALAASAHAHGHAAPKKGPLSLVKKQIDKVLPVSTLFSAEFSGNEISLFLISLP